MLSKEIIDGIVAITFSGVTTIITALSVYLTKEVIKYLAKRKQFLIQQIGADKYNANYRIAKGIFYEVEQAFKFVPTAGVLKADKFDDLLLSKIPELTQDELTHFREAIAGEINSQLKLTNLLAPAFNESRDEEDVRIEEKV